MDQVSEYEEAVLRHIENHSLTLEEVISEFSDSLTKTQVKSVVRGLKGRGYIKIERQLVAGVYSMDPTKDDAVYEDDFVLTPLGRNYLAKSTTNFTSFSNISNSNIALQSPHAVQTIRLVDQSQDLQEKVKELEQALLKRDSSAIKKVFNYIADKSVDVAIAVITGTLLR